MALDEWLRRSFILEDIFTGLARLSMPERKKLAMAVSSRVDTLRDPPKYLMGCIRKSLEQPSPYSNFPQMSAGKGGGGPVRQGDVHSVPRPLFPTSEASGPNSAGMASSMVAVQGGGLTNRAEPVSVPIASQPTVGRTAPEITNDPPDVTACPDWAKEAASDLLSKSKLVSIVYKNLAAQHVAKLSQLPPLTQYVAHIGQRAS